MHKARKKQEKTKTKQDKTWKTQANEEEIMVAETGEHYGV